MSDKSKISWTDASWNPVTGCTPISEGCAHCYAARIGKRFDGHFNVTLHPNRLEQPKHWRKPRKVFVCSMSDLFHESVPDSFICEVIWRFWNCPQHTFQMLTKRPRRMATMYKERDWGMPNAWWGVTAETQKAWDERAGYLSWMPARFRFVSFEPLLGPVDMHGEPWLNWGITHPYSWLDWVIVGGETGPGARPMDLDWAREIRDQCVAKGIPFFFKQRGGRKTDDWDLLDGKRWHQFPEGK